MKRRLKFIDFSLRKLQEIFSKTTRFSFLATPFLKEFDAESEEMHLMAEEERKRQAVLTEDRLDIAHLRQGEPSAPQAKRAKKKRERRVR